MNDTFNVKEISEYLKCSESLIRKYVRNKSIPYFRVGNRLYFRKESVDLWIQNQELQNMQQEAYNKKIKPLERVVI